MVRSWKSPPRTAGSSVRVGLGRSAWAKQSRDSCVRRRPVWGARRRSCPAASRLTRARYKACCSTAPIPRSSCRRRALGGNSASPSRKPGRFRICGRANPCCSASIPSERCAFPRVRGPRDRMRSAAVTRWHGRLSLGLLLAPALLWLAALIVLPHVDLAVLSFRARVGPRAYVASLAQSRTFFTEPLYWHVFVRTALVSVAATLLTLLLAFPIAWIIAKLKTGRAGSWLFILCLIPFCVSETVRTLGGMILLRDSGGLPSLLVKLGLTPVPVELLYHDATILVGLIYTSLLFMVIPLISSLESLDNALVEAAYDLGAGGFAILRRIVIPHAAPGITAGCIVVFMLTLGNYLTPTLLGGKNSQWFTELIYTQFIVRFNWEQGAAFGFLLLGLSTAMVALGLRVSGQRFVDVMRRS